MRHLKGAVVLALCIAVTVVTAAGGAAQETASDRTAAPEPLAAAAGPIPREAIDAAVRLGETTQQLVKIESDLAAVQQRESELTDDLVRLDQQLAENRSALDALRARVEGRAAAVYANGGSGPLAPLQIGRPEDLQAGTRYASAANTVDDRLIDQVARIRNSLEQDRVRKIEARDEVARSRGDLITFRARLDALRLEEQMLIDTWGVVSVMGRSQLTPAEITAFYESTNIRPNLPGGLTIADLARLFIEEGDRAGVRGDIAFAQSMIETGSFTEFQGYNFSGIGVCDSCTGGYLFDAAREGVRAQMQLLRSYADSTSRAADLPVPLSPVLYGPDPVEAARRFDTFFKKGSAPVWNEMGGGNWATDPTYSGKVLRMYSRMLAFAQRG